jgi:hypothetical protein
MKPSVSETQQRLSLWAKENPETQRRELYNLLYDEEWLHLAHEHVKRNAGSVTAGCDGINMTIFDQRGCQSREL